MQQRQEGYELLATLECCHTENCPTISRDGSAEPGKRIVFRDDFGMEIRMSAENLASFRDLAKAGRFDEIG